MTPLGAVSRGLVAGAIGTATMDLFLYGRYRHEGGEEALKSWELSEQVTTWDQAPAPAQVGRRIVEVLFERRLPDTRASAVNNLTQNIVEHVLVERYPEHRKLWRTLGWVERVTFASYTSYRWSADYYRQARQNEQLARLYGYR